MISLIQGCANKEATKPRVPSCILKSSFRQLFDRHHDLNYCYGISRLHASNIVRITWF